ncbi:MAG: HAD hydrolase-like protein [Eubacteriales bacterium]|jgi:phosphoglycolate phosphatase
MAEADGKNMRLAIFDLDGTLSDSGPGITKSVAYAFQKMGWPEQSEETLRSFIGPALVPQFMETGPMTREQADQAVKYYREMYNDTGKFDNYVYPGIPELLLRLKEDGYRVAVGTSKPLFFTEQILDHFGLTRVFDCISAPDLGDTSSDKKRIIDQAIEKLDFCKSKRNVIMIGDRKFDILGARDSGVTSVAVTYGFGSSEELEEAGPDYMVDSVDELQEVLLSFRK